jgi:transcriptional regulator with XRE-family HTH domain
MIDRAEEIGRMIRRLREQLDISQATLKRRLASTCGVGPTIRTISRWEAGELIPGRSWHRGLSTVFNVPVEDIQNAIAYSQIYRLTSKMSGTRGPAVEEYPS